MGAYKTNLSCLRRLKRKKKVISEERNERKCFEDVRNAWGERITEGRRKGKERELFSSYPLPISLRDRTVVFIC